MLLPAIRNFNRKAFNLRKQLREKIFESLASVLPITAIVLVLSITVAPVAAGTLVLFLFGALLLIFGMGVFTLGADLAMTPMGEGMGIEMSKSQKVIWPILISFVFGVIITMAEPDLQVLAEQVPSIPNMVIILSVAAGVGIFMMLAIAMGACVAAGGDILTDAFGVVAMVAMTPLITIQILGLVYRIRSAKAVPALQPAVVGFQEAFDLLGDDDIIEL